MDYLLLQRLFPNASKSVIAANRDAGDGDNYLDSKRGNQSKVQSMALNKPIEEVWEKYLETASVHRVGKWCGHGGETIRQALVSSGYKLNRGKWIEWELQAIKFAYGRPSVDIAKLGKALGRTHASIACKANELGLTSRNRPMSEEQKEKMRGPRDLTEEQRAILSEAAKKRISDHGHPRGFLGGKHTENARKKMGAVNIGRKIPPEITLKAMKTKAANGTLIPARGSWKSGWREIGGKRIFARSRWEANYARYLELLKYRKEILEWEHEPETFWFEKIKRGCRSYLPDFRVTHLGGTIEYHEVKGWMDSRSKTKIRRMRIYHPTVILRVFDKVWFKINTSKLRQILPGWE